MSSPQSQLSPSYAYAYSVPRVAAKPPGEDGQGRYSYSAGVRRPSTLEYEYAYECEYDSVMEAEE
jgi:hypothetical protein